MTPQSPQINEIPDGGPTDFTENILYYLHGEAIPKIPTIKKPVNLADQHRMKNDLEEYVSSDEPFSSSPDARHSPTQLVNTIAPVQYHVYPPSPSYSESRMNAPEKLPQSPAFPTTPSPIAKPPTQRSVSATELWKSKVTVGVIKADPVISLQNTLDILHDELQIMREKAATKAQETESERVKQRAEYERRETSIIEKHQHELEKHIEKSRADDIELTKLKSEMGLLKKQHCNYLMQIGDLSRSLESCQENMATQQSELDLLKNENVLLKPQLEASTIRCKELTREVEESKNLCRVAGDRVEDLESEKTEYLYRNDMLAKELNTAKQRDKSSNSELAILKRVQLSQELDLERKQHRIALLTQDLQQREDSKKADDVKLEKLANFAERKQEAAIELQKQLTASSTLNLELDKEFDDLKRKFSAYKMEQAELFKEAEFVKLESERRGRLLMQYWGSQECGPNLNKHQPYRYMAS